MSVHVTINDTELQRKIAKFAILSQKGLDEATRAVASRFTKAAVGNTCLLYTSPSPRDS